MALDADIACALNTTAAGLLRVHGTLLDHSCLTPRDVELARGCGPSVTSADGRARDGAA